MVILFVAFLVLAILTFAIGVNAEPKVVSQLSMFASGLSSMLAIIKLGEIVAYLGIYLSNK
jgi:hypothetical protein